jgi:hypothetical protein
MTHMWSYKITPGNLTMNKQWLNRILNDLAEREIPAQGDPWLVIRARMEREQRPSKAKDDRNVIPRRQLSDRTTAIVVTVTLLVAFLATPLGQALAAGIIRFFIPLSEDNLPAETLTTPAPLVLVDVDFKNQAAYPTATDAAGTCSSQMSLQCTLADAQGQAGFPLQQIGVLPEDLYFKSASIEGPRVTALYECPSGCEIWLEQQKLDGGIATLAPVGKEATVEQVQIRGVPGEYVRGTFFGDSGTWDTNANVAFLRWQEGDILYTISLVLAQPGGRPSLQLSSSSLAALAEGLTHDLSAVQPLNPAYLTNLQDAQALADFQIIEPSWLPEGYLFSFASYDETSRFVCLNYAYGNSASYPSLFIRQSILAPPSELQPAKGAVLEKTRVKSDKTSLDAEYVTGFSAPDGACGGSEALFRAGQALLWRTAERSFEVYGEFPSPYGGAGLSQEDLLALAAGLTGGTVPTETDVNPNHLGSFAVAEEYAGYSIRTPTKLPAGSGLRFIRALNGSILSQYSRVAADHQLHIAIYQCPAAAQVSPCLDLLNEIPADFRQTTEVNGEKAVYARGALGTTPAENAETWHTQDPWLTTRLNWQAEGWNYAVVSTGAAIERDQLIFIAESLR